VPTRYGDVFRKTGGGGPMFGSKVKIDKALLEKATKYSQVAGYSSAEEFINHALEKEIAKLEGADSEQEIKKRLKGLGYIS
jgi:hypothetical protein